MNKDLYVSDLPDGVTRKRARASIVSSDQPYAERFSPIIVQNSEDRNSKRSFSERRARLKKAEYIPSFEPRVQTGFSSASQPTPTGPPFPSHAEPLVFVAKSDAAPPVLEVPMLIDPTIPSRPSTCLSPPSSSNSRGHLDRLRKLRSRVTKPHPVDPRPSIARFSGTPTPANATDVPNPVDPGQRPATFVPPAPTASQLPVNCYTGYTVDSDESDNGQTPAKMKSSPLPVNRHSGDILELTDESDDEEYRPPFPVSKELKTLYAKQHEELLCPEPEVLPRKLHSSWKGTHTPKDWICRPQDRHTLQAVRDRQIVDAFDDRFPQYVICPAEMRYFHNFLETRYRFNDLRDYQHLIGIFRNTQAVEAIKSHQRYDELEDLRNLVHDLRLDIDSLLIKE